MAETKKKKSRTASRGPTLPDITGFPDELREIRDILANRYSFEGKIAEGKTGITYRLSILTNKHHFVCLKTIRPSITDSERRRDIAETLKKEVRILSKLDHRCLPAIVEDGAENRHPFYVCTYHPGKTCDSYRVSSRRLITTEASFVIFQLISVISHVHAAERTHCDLHPGNVLLGDDIFRDGLLVIDFGSGHRNSDSSPGTANRGNAGFKPPESLRRDRLQIDRTSLADEFRPSDIAGLGTLLTQMHEVFVGSASPIVQDEYRRFCRDLQQNRIDDWDHIRDRASTVFEPLRCISENADLFVLGDATRESITIPVIGRVDVAPRVWR